MEKLISKQNSNSFLKIKSRTWERDSYGLFDYEAKEISKSKFKIENQTAVIREKNKISIERNLKVQLDKNQNLDTLCKIHKLNGGYFVSNWRDSCPNFTVKDLWMVIGSKNFENKSNYILQQGDVFKAGRLAFKILQIRTNFDKKLEDYDHSLLSSVKLHYEENVDFKENQSIPTIHTQEIMNRSSNSKICRICLNESNTLEDPLLSPCKCSGSLKFVHFKCLQIWIQSRLHLDKNNGIVSIEWTGLSCELCKTSFPLSFQQDNTHFDLLELSDHNKNKFENFIVLESYSKHFKTNGIHYIDFTERTAITIGRSELSDIKLSDISVSRDHVKILFEHGNFYLKDEASKFGTLLLVRNPVPISQNKQLFQNGRTVLSLQEEKSWYSYFSFCPFSCENTESIVKNSDRSADLLLHSLIK